MAPEQRLLRATVTTSSPGRRGVTLNAAVP
jgi:hypothetical protein